jgi:hypothetical protein
MDREEWDAKLDAFEAQGGTFIRHAIAMPEDFTQLVDQALHGDLDADMLLSSRSQFMEFLHAAPRGSRVTCCICPTILRPRQFVFGLALPFGVDKPSSGLSFGICHRCGPDRAAAQAAAFRAIQNVWPDAISRTIHPGSGNA